VDGKQQGDSNMTGHGDRVSEATSSNDHQAARIGLVGANPQGDLAIVRQMNGGQSAAPGANKQTIDSLDLSQPIRKLDAVAANASWAESAERKQVNLQDLADTLASMSTNEQKAVAKQLVASTHEYSHWNFADNKDGGISLKYTSAPFGFPNGVNIPFSAASITVDINKLGDVKAENHHYLVSNQVAKATHH
jgi:hypothetical protein